jgi:DNA-binding NarL/FixJ family response regulator
MRVILADDQREVRSALRVILGEKPGVSILGEAASADELVSLVKSSAADLVILDWELSGSKPRELFPLLFKLKPQLAVIALSSRPQFQPLALNFGARAFVCKSDPPEVLLAAVDRCLVG